MNKLNIAALSRPDVMNALDYALYGTDTKSLSSDMDIWTDEVTDEYNDGKLHVAVTFTAKREIDDIKCVMQVSYFEEELVGLSPEGAKQWADEFNRAVDEGTDLLLSESNFVEEFTTEAKFLICEAFLASILDEESTFEQIRAFVSRYEDEIVIHFIVDNSNYERITPADVLDTIEKLYA